MELIPGVNLMAAVAKPPVEAKMGVGQRVQFDASGIASPSWSSDDESVATVDAFGNVTAISTGTALISAEGETDAKVWRLTVKPAPTGVWFPYGMGYLGVGDVVKLDPQVGDSVGGFTYTTSRSKYVQVNQDGYVYGARRGYAYVTVETYNGHSATLRINVVRAPKSVSVTLPSEILAVGDTMQLSYSLPKNTAGSVIWQVSDESMATIDQAGRMTALREGSVMVRAMTYNGKIDFYTVRLVAAPTSVSIGSGEQVLGVGQDWAIPARVNNGSACFGYTYESANPAIASVDKNGRVHAQALGETTIYATTYNGVRGECRVIVKSAPTGVWFPYGTGYIGVGDTFKLEPQSDGGVTGFTYSSSRSKYVQVDQNGYVYGARRGNAYVTVRTYNGYTATVRVYVVRAPKSVSVYAPNDTMGVGDTMQLSYSLPKNSAGSAVWQVSDESMATIDQAGRLTALREGTVLVRALTYNGKYQIKTIRILAAPRSVSVGSGAITLGVGQSAAVGARVNSGSACNAFTYKSMNSSVARVSGGWITGVSTGETEIEVTTYNGVSARCRVTVKPAPTGVWFPYSTGYIGVGDTFQLDPQVGNAVGGFTYSTSRSKYVRVNQDGLIYGARRGSAYITVRTYNGHTARVKVNVVRAPKSVSISPENVILGVGDTMQFSAWVNSGSMGSITFVSSDPSKLKVDASGRATALSGGEVYVAADTYNGKRAFTKVTIYKAPEWIEANFAQATMSAGETKKIQVRLSEGSYSVLRYSSSNPSVARVDQNGVITAVSRGTATILVETSAEDVFAQISLEVWNAPGWVELDGDKTLNVDETMLLKPVIDANARTTWRFTSSNPNVASINANGEVTAVNRGRTVLTATAHNGVSASVTLTVYDPWYPESVRVTNPVELLNVGDRYEIQTAVTPESAQPRLSWTSTNPQVASVDQNGAVTALSGGFTTIVASSQKNPACRVEMLVCVKFGALALTLPKRITDVSEISSNLARIDAIRRSAFDEITELQRRGAISASDANTRKTVLSNAFRDYAFPWMTPAYQQYWKAENSENGVKDFKPGNVYYGMPYISGGSYNRRYNAEKAVSENRYTSSGSGYYLLNQSRLLNGLYVGNDCSSFCNAANWGVNSKRIGDRTDDIFSSSYYKTVSLADLRPGDMICLANRHVVFFLYYVDSARTQIMILENGGAEAGVNTVHCSLYKLSYYQSLGYRGRRLKSLG